MFAAIGMMACPDLAVSAEVMRHIVDVESGSNPYAIGVVGGQLVRQPQNLAEALATVHMLDAKGYNYSLGIAQVNRANLGKYGLDSYAKAFEPCPNLTAGARILAACYARSGNDWGKAFSCYYSGNFTTGYRDGYVQKVYDSIRRDAGLATAADVARAIPLKTAPTAASDAVTGPRLAPDSPGYRVAIRSIAFYKTTASTVSANGGGVPGQSPPAASQTTHILPAPAALPATAAGRPAPASAPTPPAHGAQPAATVAASPVFVPQVTGPGDPTPKPAERHATPKQVASTAALPASGTSTIPHEEHADAAFVF